MPANNTRKYVLHASQFAVVNEETIPIKFNSSSPDNLTSDKKQQVETFIIANKLNVKKESGFLKAISFYNSINE
jgi:hypothetical protein